MDVSAEPGVIGQVPARMVGVFVDDDGIGVPGPVATIANVSRRDAEIEAVEPEAGRAASGKVEDMPRAEAASEAPVLPGTIEMIARVIGTGIVPNPFAIGVDVRGIRVSGAIAEIPLLRGGMCLRLGGSGARMGSGAMRRYVSATDSMRSTVLLGALLREGASRSCSEGSHRNHQKR